MSGECLGYFPRVQLHIVIRQLAYIEMVLDCGRDEEYDRGKKKKIRIKEESYRGPNPFQMLASKRQKETKKKWSLSITDAKTAYRI